MTNKFKLVEFCAGTGAFSYAFEKTNCVETIFANDIDKNSEIIFNENFKTKLTLKDIHELDIKNDIPSHDIMTAGFPCQPFSIAGNQEGFNDERSNVFWKLLKIIEFHKPKIIVFENVKNLLSHNNGNTMKIIEKSIKDLKYNFVWKILNTCEISEVPQNRERIFIICFKKKKYMRKFEFPDNSTTKKPLNSYVSKDVDSKYYYTNKLKVWNEINSKITEHISTNKIYQYRRYYVRENKNNVCPTLTANMGVGGHNVPLLKDDKGIRKLTPKECFKLQGFPDEYKIPKINDASLYKLAGNAVSVPVIIKIAENIVKILNKK